ncbi:hypothetical protein Zmor_023550 [Zophobas morio]|uniref:Uncharacterized protein n=1 Tax=Zophobas morio TaxID=2755281 RepID=A0AA38HYG5_9CUCU|nr:hypothetical protein Zmor_023550 [Zophobas morio]
MGSRGFWYLHDVTSPRQRSLKDKPRADYRKSQLRRPENARSGVRKRKGWTRESRWTPERFWLETSRREYEFKWGPPSGRRLFSQGVHRVSEFIQVNHEVILYIIAVTVV